MTAEFGLTHFVGVGGAGMSAIATVLLQLGCPVSGSDMKDTPVTNRLAQLGARISVGHHQDNIPVDAQQIVVSTAISEDNPELLEAQRRGIAVVHRAEMLSRLMKRQKGIAIAGAHGKTTTTAMIGLTLVENGLDPTVVVGGHIPAFQGNATLGYGDYLVAEADESDGSFLKLLPHIAVVTNVEDDHLDYYGSVEKIKGAFVEFVRRVPRDGCVVLCVDDPFLREIAQQLPVPIITYAIDHDADIKAQITKTQGGISAQVCFGDQLLGQLELTIPGRHNLQNALACVAVNHHLGLSFSEIATSMRHFKGVGRRFQTIGGGNGIWVVDDYAHHPTEIKATIDAARETGVERVIAVFQPHRYSRTKQLFKEFGQSLSGADMVILDEVYAAGEQPLPGITSELIYQQMDHNQVHLIKGNQAIVSFLADKVQPGDLLLTLGAGDVWTIANQLVERLKINGG